MRLRQHYLLVIIQVTLLVGVVEVADAATAGQQQQQYLTDFDFLTAGDSSDIGNVESGDQLSSDEWFKEKKLVKQLLSQQDGRQLGRPVSNYSLPVEVEFGINLIQVLRVNEESGQLITNIWTHFRWCDPSLAWNQTAIGVDIVRIPAEEIWTPDVALFNYADDRMRQHRSTLAVGHIDWIPTGIYKSACSIDTFSFPFDEQICYMTFRSLSMGVNTLTLKFVDGRTSMSLDSYVPNPEWEMAENTAVRSIKVGKRGMQTSFYDLTFTLRLKRRSAFHRYVLVLPCVLLSLTAGVLFVLPPESPAKIQIGIFIFQGFFLLLNLLKNSTPPSGSRSPIIGLYYSTSMIATTVVMFACGFLVEVHFRADRKAPMTQRLRSVIIRGFAKYLFIPIPKKSPLDIKRELTLARKVNNDDNDTTAKVIPTIKNRVSRTPSASQLHPSIIVSRTPPTPTAVSESKAEAKSPGFFLFNGADSLRQRLSSFGSSSIKSSNKLSSLRQLLRSPSSRRSRSSRQQQTKKNKNKFDEEHLNQTENNHSNKLMLLSDLIELRKTFQRVSEKQSSREYADLVKCEWLIAIMVFDRVFFFAYVFYIIASLYLLLPQEEEVA